MSSNTKTPEGFRVKNTVTLTSNRAIYDASGHKVGIKSNRTYTIPAAETSGTFESYGAQIDHSPEALALIRQKKIIPDLPNVTETAIRDAHEVIAEDKCLPFDHRFKAALHLVASIFEEKDAIEFMDMVCAGAHRKIERKDKDAAFHARKLQEAKGDDRETEIGSAQYGEQEDKVNKLRDDVDRWVDISECANTVYGQIDGNRWTPRLEAAPLADAGAAIMWEQQLRTMKLMQGYRVCLMGDTPHEAYLPKVIEQLKRKATELKKDLILITGDAATGFEPAVDSIGTKLGITVLRVPLPDRKVQGVTKFFKRNSQMFNELKPNAAVVFGGGGVQGNIIELARQDKIDVHAVVCPKGWTKDAGGLRRIG